MFGKYSGRGAASLALASVLASCGGGGSSTPTPTPTPPPVPLSITSSATASVEENSTASFYTASATGGNGTTTFSLGSTPDAARFTLTSAGSLRFTHPANFDLEADSNGDNIFELEIVASSGSQQASKNLRVTLVNSREGIRVTRIATGLADPVGLARTDTAGEILVGERSGRVLAFDGPLGTLKGEVRAAPATADYELLDIAFGLQGAFPGNLLLLSREGDRLFARRPAGEANGVFAGGSLGILNGRRNVDAALGFAPDGGLYAAMGNPSGDVAQAGEGIGTLRRFVGAGCSASTRTMCFGQVGEGIRQPGALSTIDGEFLLLDRGDTREHEINRFLANQQPIHFGWPFFEGTVEIAAGAPADRIGPTIAYTAGSEPREGAGPVGGIDYQGTIAGIENHFVFADQSGTIWSFPRGLLTDGFLHRTDELERRTEDFAPDAGSLDAIVAIAADDSGTLYILDGDGELFRVDPA